jgi:hypothetical protein
VVAYGGMNVLMGTKQASHGDTRARRTGRPLATLTAAVALAVIAGGCSSICDEDNPWMPVTHVASAEAATPLAAPNCEARMQAAAGIASKASAGTAVDPDLVEIAQLEIERDCYKQAEETTRQQLEWAQQTYGPLK